MATHTTDLEAEIRRRSASFGLALGILSLPVSLLAGAPGGCCPPGSIIGVLPVLNSGFWAGFLGAVFLDWKMVQPDRALAVAVKVGLRTALVASSIGAVVTLVASLLTSGEIPAADDPSMTEVAGGVAAMGGKNALILLLGILPGVALGVLGGLAGAAIKGPSGSPPPPAPPSAHRS